MWPNSQFLAELVTFTKEILNGKRAVNINNNFGGIFDKNWSKTASIQIFKNKNESKHLVNLANYIQSR